MKRCVDYGIWRPCYHNHRLFVVVVLFHHHRQVLLANLHLSGRGEIQHVTIVFSIEKTHFILSFSAVILLHYLECVAHYIEKFEQRLVEFRMVFRATNSEPKMIHRKERFCLCSIHYSIYNKDFASISTNKFGKRTPFEWLATSSLSRSLFVSLSSSIRMKVPISLNLFRFPLKPRTLILLKISLEVILRRPHY